MRWAQRHWVLDLPCPLIAWSEQASPEGVEKCVAAWADLGEGVLAVHSQLHSLKRAGGCARQGPGDRERPLGHRAVRMDQLDPNPQHARACLLAIADRIQDPGAGKAARTLRER